MMKFIKAIFFGAALLALPSANVEAKKVGKLRAGDLSGVALAKRDDLVMAAVMQKNLSDQVCPPKKARDKAFASACRTDFFGSQTGAEIDFSISSGVPQQFFGIVPPTNPTDGFTVLHSGNYLIQYFLRPVQSSKPVFPDTQTFLPLYEIEVTSGGVTTPFPCSRYGSPIDFNPDSTTFGSLTVTSLDVSGFVVLSLKAGDVIHLVDLSTNTTGASIAYPMDPVFQTGGDNPPTTVVSGYILIEQL